MSTMAHSLAQELKDELGDNWVEEFQTSCHVAARGVPKVKTLEEISSELWHEGSETEDEPRVRGSARLALSGRMSRFGMGKKDNGGDSARREEGEASPPGIARAVTATAAEVAALKQPFPRKTPKRGAPRPPRRSEAGDTAPAKCHELPPRSRASSSSNHRPGKPQPPVASKGKAGSDKVMSKIERSPAPGQGRSQTGQAGKSGSALSSVTRQLAATFARMGLRGESSRREEERPKRDSPDEGPKKGCASKGGGSRRGASQPSPRGTKERARKEDPWNSLPITFSTPAAAMGSNFNDAAVVRQAKAPVESRKSLEPHEEAASDEDFDDTLETFGRAVASLREKGDSRMDAVDSFDTGVDSLGPAVVSSRKKSGPGAAEDWNSNPICFSMPHQFSMPPQFSMPLDPAHLRSLMGEASFDEEQEDGWSPDGIVPDSVSSGTEFQSSEFYMYGGSSETSQPHRASHSVPVLRESASIASGFDAQQHEAAAYVRNREQAKSNPEALDDAPPASNGVNADVKSKGSVPATCPQVRYLSSFAEHRRRVLAAEKEEEEELRELEPEGLRNRSFTIRVAALKESLEEQQQPRLQRSLTTTSHRRNDDSFLQKTWGN